MRRGSKQPADAYMTEVEWQSHFSMWAVTSAPLILGFDLSDDKVMQTVWPIIANTEVLAVSQQYSGHPGYLVLNSTNSTVVSTDHGCSGGRPSNELLPDYQVWAKPQPNNTLAVLVVSVSPSAEGVLELPLGTLWPRNSAESVTSVSVRDIVSHTTHANVAVGALRIDLSKLGVHGSTFLLLTPV